MPTKNQLVAAGLNVTLESDLEALKGGRSIETTRLLFLKRGGADGWDPPQPSIVALLRPPFHIVALVEEASSVQFTSLLEAGFDDVLRTSIDPADFQERVLALSFSLLHEGHQPAPTAMLQESMAKAQAVLHTTVDAIITIDDRGLIESFNVAAERIFGFRAEEVIGKNVSMLMPAPFKHDHDDYIRSYQDTGLRKIIGIGREVIGLRKDGTTFPMELAVSEVHLTDRTIFTGIVRDISERRVLENELIRISEQERASIGRELHDGLGQTLTGIGLIAQNVARRLESKEVPEASQVAEIAQLIKEADQEARTLARGLVPIEFQPEGLTSAITRLASNTERIFGIRCTIEEAGAQLSLHNTATTTHMYRIVQEALNNAARHSEATQIKVLLAAGPDKARVRIQDNGKGMPEDMGDHPGMGLRIMQHRAHMIGGSLEVRSSPGEGTIVTCTMYRNGVPLRS